MTPKAYLIAGPNGAGKTTFAREFLPHFVHCPEFLNADLIAAGLSPFDPDRAAIRAGRLLRSRMNELIEANESFGFESTLAGKGHAASVRRMKERGYEVEMFFLWLPAVEMAISRVAHRVSRGGHNIPEPVIRRRYSLGFQNFLTLYRPLASSWSLFDNSSETPQSIATQQSGDLNVVDSEMYQTVLRVRGASSMATHPIAPNSTTAKALAALKQAVDKVIEEGVRRGSTLVVWRDGRVQEIPAIQIARELEEKRKAGSADARDEDVTE